MEKELAQELAATAIWVLLMYRLTHEAIWKEPSRDWHYTIFLSVNPISSITLLWLSVGLNNYIWRIKMNAN